MRVHHTHHALPQMLEMYQKYKAPQTLNLDDDAGVANLFPEVPVAMGWVCGVGVGGGEGDADEAFERCT